eukprot:434294-Hanusia_phi.AAC.3
MISSGETWSEANPCACVSFAPRRVGVEVQGAEEERAAEGSATKMGRRGDSDLPAPPLPFPLTSIPSNLTPPLAVPLGSSVDSQQLGPTPTPVPLGTSNSLQLDPTPTCPPWYLRFPATVNLNPPLQPVPPFRVLSNLTPHNPRYPSRVPQIPRN